MRHDELSELGYGTSGPLPRKDKSAARSSRGLSRIVAVDDSEMGREWLTSIIKRQRDLRFCCEARELADVLALLTEVNPDMLILGLSFNRNRTFDAIRMIRSKFDGIPMLVFSDGDETLRAEESLRAGAQGYVGKCASKQTVVAAIRRVLSGGVYLSDSAADSIFRGLRGGVVARSDASAALSARELQLFELMGTGYKPAEVAARMQLGFRTYQTYAARIMLKLGLANTRELSLRAVAWMKTRGA